MSVGSERSCQVQDLVIGGLFGLSKVSDMRVMDSVLTDKSKLGVVLPFSTSYSESANPDDQRTFSQLKKKPEIAASIA